MSDPPDRPSSGHAWLAKRLSEETSITEAEATELIVMLGTNWSSLVREAHIIRKRRPPKL